MAYDKDLAEAVTRHLEGTPGLGEKRMFGGLAFLIHGNMAVAASGGGGLLLRADPDLHDQLVAQEFVETAVMGGRSMNGWLRADADRLGEAMWPLIDQAVAYAQSLPAK
ncbi:TfoX/Sxy family protein [Calidifontibacter terrae]